MKTHHSILVSAVIGISMYSPILLASNVQLQAPVAKPLQLAYVATGGTVRTYNGTRLRYYPNHVIVADSYDRDVIHNIAGLARDLGWDVVYVQIPLEYREYASTYFVGYGIGVNYFGVNVNPDQTLNRFYGHKGYPGWNGRHGEHRDHSHHRTHRVEHHKDHKEHKHHGKEHKHHGKHHGDNHNHHGSHHNHKAHHNSHKGGHHGGHHGGGHHGGHHGGHGGHHGGGHHR